MAEIEIIRNLLEEEKEVEDQLYDLYYVFIRNFGYIPFEEFLKIPRRHLYEIMQRLEREMRELNKVR